jgi:hypothetical protein
VEFLRLQRAWVALSTPNARDEYDRQLKDDAIVASTATSNHLEIDLDDME